MPPPVSRTWLPILVAVVIYLAFGIGRALTAAPWVDEAWYASPSWSYIHFGNTGTPLLEPAGMFWKGINERTYWVVPLQFAAQIPWFKIFDFSLLSARFFAMAWGLIALLAWGHIVKRITGDMAMAAGTMLLLACDYQFVAQMSLDRMDAMSLALAALGFAAYVELREKNLTLAVLLSQAGVAACGLTHPTPGIPAFVALLALTLYLDRKRIRFQHVAIAAVPYIVGALGWYWYIAPAPDLFRAQFLGNVTDMDRLGGFKNPLRAIWRELGRYLDMGGFQTGMAPLYRIKICVICVYVVAAAWLCASRETRQNPALRPLLLLWLVYVVMMTFYDNTKEGKYGVHMLPLYDAVTAVWLVWLWRKGGSLRWAGVLGGLVFVAVSTGGLLYTIAVKDEYHKAFMPAAAYLEQHATRDDLIMAGSEFGFPLGFDRKILDDTNFGYITHKTPRFFVMSPNYRLFFDVHARREPEISNYLVGELDRRYDKVYSHGGFDIFKLRDGY